MHASPEDNSYPPGVTACLELVRRGSCLYVLSNEVGFKSKNIESLCKAGMSTKKEVRRLQHAWITCDHYCTALLLLLLLPLLLLLRLHTFR